MTQLDPAVVEVVAKARYEQDPVYDIDDAYLVPWDDLGDFEQTAYRIDADAFIRAIDTFRAAAVREAVDEVSDAACEAGRKVGCDLMSVWTRYADAKAALLALVNAEETE